MRYRHLTPEQVRVIRRWHQARSSLMRPGEICALYGITNSRLSLICRRISYKDVRDQQ